MYNETLILAQEYNKSVDCLNNGNWKKAKQILEKVLKKSEFKEALTNYGNCLKYAGQDKEMFKAYHKAISYDTPFIDRPGNSDYHPALNNLGLAYYMYDELDKALMYYDLALKAKPDFYDAIWNKSTALLKKACAGATSLFDEGWLLYDARFRKTPPVVLKNSNPNLIWWDFSSPYDEILVLAEQGIGDNFMWGRYLNKLHDVTVQCDSSLAPLFEFAGYKTLQDTSQYKGKYAVPMCSLARLGGFDNGSWLKGFGSTHEFNKENFNVGIVWAGNPSHVNDAYRSVNIRRFHSLSDICSLYSLSPNFSGDKKVKPLSIKTWSDTAEYINGLDLVITIDSSIAHFCGCLDKECWVLMPYKETDFRWGTTGPTNIWYPSVRVFRNKQSWENVFSEVKTALINHINEVRHDS